MKLDFATPAYDECLELRNQILRIPLGLVFSIRDMLDEQDEFHFGLYDIDMNLMACASFRQIGKNVLKMRQVAVKATEQRKGIGSIMVKKLERWALDWGATRIELNARDIAVKFYLKLAYGITGEEFTEVGIPHRKMYKQLDV